MRISSATFKSAVKTGKKIRGSVVLEKAVFENSVDASGDDRRIKFVFSTPTPDRENDVILPDGIDCRNYLKNPIILWSHEHGSTPIAKCIGIAVENNQLVGTVEFLPADFPVSGQQAEAALQLIKRGMLGTSIGFLPKAWDYDDATDGVIFTSCELLEVSVVPIPCNQEALPIDDDADETTPSEENRTEEPEKSVEPHYLKAARARERVLRLFS